MWRFIKYYKKGTSNSAEICWSSLLILSEKRENLQSKPNLSAVQYLAGRKSREKPLSLRLGKNNFKLQIPYQGNDRRTLKDIFGFCFQASRAGQNLRLKCFYTEAFLRVSFLLSLVSVVEAQFRPRCHWCHGDSFLQQEGTGPLQYFIRDA